MKNNAKKHSAREFLELVAPNLYRHRINKNYYGQKKMGGKKKTQVLLLNGKVTTDRQTANQLLRDWLAGLAGTNIQAADMSLDALLVRFLEVRAGLAEGTRENDRSFVRKFRKTFQKPLTTFVSRVTTADLKEWLAKASKRKGKALRNVSVNNFRLFLLHLFEVAVQDRVIAKANNPFDGKAIPAKKIEAVARPIPTEGEFVRIVEEMRNPSWAIEVGKNGGFRPATYPEPADFIEFLGRAGVGQAEAVAIRWEHVGDTHLTFVRKKTGRIFYVPIFDDLRPLIERRRAAAGPNPTGRVLARFNPKRGFFAAQVRLGLERRYSMRNLRSMFVVRALVGGIPAKDVAEWQGHNDGGRLIMTTYSQVVRAQSDQKTYEAMQIARMNAMSGKIVPFAVAA